MYVQPFWSYEFHDNTCTLENHLTRQRADAPNILIYLLEAIHEGATGKGALEAERLLGIARRLEILFGSREEAEDLFERVEAAWALDVPTVDQIELTNQCPYSCTMCPRTTSMSRSIGYMDINLFESLVDQIADRQRYVGLHHFGESLVYRHLGRAVRLARERGLLSGLSCNPPTLHPKVGAELLDAGIANMLFSLDSLDAEVYRSIRGKAADFKRADTNLRSFIGARNNGGYETFTTLQMIRMRCNADEASAFLNYCRDVGVDRGVVIRLGRWDFDNDYIEELGEFDSPGYRAYCSRPWRSVVVLWDARVVPCCHDYNGTVVLGDLTRQTLAEVLRSEAYCRFRADNYTEPLCQKCAYSRAYRERQRQTNGFLAFHRSRIGSKKYEWVNPDSGRIREAQALFNSFDLADVDV